MPAIASSNLTLKQGSTFNVPIAYKPGGVLLDTSTYTARMSVRHSKDRPETLLDLTNANGRLILGIQGDAPDEYNIQILVDAATTATLIWDEKIPAVYDLLIESGGVVTYVLEGKFTLNKRVTV